MLDWCHIIEMVLNILTKHFLHRLVYKIKHKNFTNNEQKRYRISVNIRDEFHFSTIHWSMNAMSPVQI